MLLLLCGAMNMSAQTMRQVWMDMPDEMVVYLNRSNRTELADYVEMKVDAAIGNKLGDTTRVERLTPDYIRVKLNDAHRLEMKLVSRDDGSKMVCVVNTFFGPAADSQIAFYDTEWHLLSDIQVTMPTSEQLCARPEGMTQERFDELKAMLDPELTEIILSETDDSITFRRSIPAVSSDDMNELKSILTPFFSNFVVISKKSNNFAI